MICRMKKRGKILAAIDERVPSLKVTRKQYKTGPSVQFYTLASPITFAIILHCAAFFMAHRFPRENHECVSWPIETHSARSATRNTRSIVTLAFRRIGGGKGGGIRWQKKKEIRYVNGHRAPLLCFACKNMETKKIWKRKKRNGEFLKLC